MVHLSFFRIIPRLYVEKDRNRLLKIETDFGAVQDELRQ
jgi:hypothetical protein